MPHDALRARPLQARGSRDVDLVGFVGDREAEERRGSRVAERLTGPEERLICSTPIDQVGQVESVRSHPAEGSLDVGGAQSTGTRAVEFVVADTERRSGEIRGERRTTGHPLTLPDLRNAPQRLSTAGPLHAALRATETSRTVGLAVKDSQFATFRVPVTPGARRGVRTSIAGGARRRKPGGRLASGRELAERE